MPVAVDPYPLYAYFPTFKGTIGDFDAVLWTKIKKKMLISPVWL